MKHIKYYSYILFFIVCMMCIKLHAKALSNGVYIIHSAINENYVLDMNGGYTRDFVNIQLYKENNQISQKFIINKLENNTYIISSAYDESYSLDINGGVFNNYTNIQLYRTHKGISQQWIITEEEDGFYHINSIDDNYSLDANGGYARNFVNIQLFKTNNMKSQKFSFEKVLDLNSPIENGIYNISSKLDNNMMIDIYGAKFSNLSNINLFQKNDGLAQKFYIQQLDNGFYTIKSYYDSSYALDVHGASRNIETNVELYKYSGNANQQWAIKKSSNGGYNIISKCNYLALDVYGGKSSNGANIQVYTLHNSDGQIFEFNKLEPQRQRTINDGYYVINTVLDRQKVIDIYRANINDRENVEIYDANYSLAQKWYIRMQDDGYYDILVDADNNYALQVDGDNINIGHTKYTDNQKWIIEKNNKGFYIISKTGKHLDLTGLSTRNETNIQPYDYSGTDAQTFDFINTISGVGEQVIEDGVYNIKSFLSPNKVVDVYGGYTNNYNNIELWDNNDSMAQKFKVTYVSTGLYTISPLVDTRKLVSAEGNNIGNNVSIYQRVNDIKQQWIIKDAGDGWFNIISNSSGLYLDVANANTANGTNILLWEGNSGNNQKFKFEQTSYTDLVIDVSSNQGNIDWARVKASGIYGVILRVNDGVYYNNYDPNFSYNIEQVKKYNLRYGLYTYSYAENYREGQMFAEFVNNAIREYGLNPTLGVYMDLESNVLTHYMGPNEYTDAFNGFKSIIPNAKIYTYLYYANTALNSPYLRSHITWIAQYYDYCTYDGYYNLWQFTDNGRIDGIPNAVDISHFYP